MRNQPASITVWRLLPALFALLAFAPPAAALNADYWRGGWRTPTGGEPHIYYFVIRGERVTGAYCRNCSDATTIGFIDGTWNEKAGLDFTVTFASPDGSIRSVDKQHATLVEGQLVVTEGAASSRARKALTLIKDPRKTNPGGGSAYYLPPGTPPKLPAARPAAGSGGGGGSAPQPPYLFRGRVMGKARLVALVKSERQCSQPAADRSPRPASVAAIDVSPEGVTGKVPLDSGHYEDVYVKTPSGWRFRSRNNIPKKAEDAGFTFRDFAQIRQLAGDHGQFEDVYTKTSTGLVYRSCGMTIDPLSRQEAARTVHLKGDDGRYDDVYVRTAIGWRFKSRAYVQAEEGAGARPVR